MSRPIKIKPGPLSNVEKIFIAENFLDKTVDYIAKKIKKKEDIVQAYIDKISFKDKNNKKDEKNRDEVKKEIKSRFIEQTGTAVVMNQNGSSLPINIKKYKSEFSTK